MQEKSPNQAEQVIQKIKFVFKLKNDVELAAFLQVSNKTISGWKARNTLDYDLLLEKCEGLNFHWLFKDEGNAFSPGVKGKELRENFVHKRATEIVQERKIPYDPAKDFAGQELDIMVNKIQTHTTTEPQQRYTSEQSEQDLRKELEELRKEYWKIVGKAEALQEIINRRLPEIRTDAAQAQE